MRSTFPFLARLLTAAMLLLAAFPVIASAAGPQDRTVTVMGVAAIHGDDVATAREEAEAAALETAVSTAVLDAAPEDRMVADFEKAASILFVNPLRFLLDYQIQAEGAADGRYRVLLRATISGAALSGALSEAGLTVGSGPLPKLAIFMAERMLDDTTYRYWWGENQFGYRSYSEMGMKDAFTRKGFKVIDARAARSLAEEPMSESPGRDLAALLSFAAKIGADAVVFGEAAVERAANTMGEDLRSFRAIVRAKVIRTDSGETIAETEKEGGSVHGDDFAGAREALMAAGILAAEDLSAAAADAWQKADQPAAPIEVTVTGTGRLVDFVRFRGALQEVPGVTGVLTREMRPDGAVVMVDYKGTPQSLAEALLRKDYQGFGINIESADETGLRATLIAPPETSIEPARPEAPVVPEGDAAQPSDASETGNPQEADR